MYLLLTEYTFRFTRITLSDFTFTKCEVQVGRERFERFRMAEMHVLPVGVGEDRMEQQVSERLAADGDLQ